MNDNNLDVQQALKDIALLRHALNQSGQVQTETKLSGITLDANLLLQTIALATSLTLGIIEIFGGNTMTETLMYGARDSGMIHTSVILMGTFLVGLLIALYFILWRAAQYTGEPVGSYISRNFRYMQNLSLISDLLIKFATLSLLLIAGKPQWIAPALMAFTGDYLLQARLFTLPTKFSVVLGMLCLIAAITQFTENSNLLVIPLMTFSVVAAMSVGRLVLRLRRQTQANA